MIKIVQKNIGLKKKKWLRKKKKYTSCGKSRNKLNEDVFIPKRNNWHWKRAQWQTHTASVCVCVCVVFIHCVWSCVFWLHATLEIPVGNGTYTVKMERLFHSKWIGARVCWWPKTLLCSDDVYRLTSVPIQLRANRRLHGIGTQTVTKCVVNRVYTCRYIYTLAETREKKAEAEQTTLNIPMYLLCLSFHFAC